MAELDGKVALVTGSGRGIGRATALTLARHGASVVLTARTAPEIEDAADGIAVDGGTAVAVPGDVTDEVFVGSLFEAIRERFGRIDILVNNAGTGRFGPVESMPVADLRETLELNVVGAFMCMQAAIRLMLEKGDPGKIVNVGSVRSHWTESGDGGAYNASKYALRGMTESVARQMATEGRNIAVGLLCPGIVDTTLTNPDGEDRPEWLNVETVAKAVLHAVTAPPDVNVFDTVVFPTTQQPW